MQFIESQFDDLYRNLKKENFLADITDKEEMIAASVRSANASNDMLENLIKSCLFTLFVLYGKYKEEAYVGIWICKGQ
nr:hypothetical protein [uncultured Agathobacter sp.]